MICESTIGKEKEYSGLKEDIKIEQKLMNIRERLYTWEIKTQ